MKEITLNMYKNIIQLKKLPYCKIVAQKRNGFSAELDIRGGKYRVRIDYQENKSPKVYMITPQIDMSNSLEIHTFGMHYHSAYKRNLPKLCLTYWDEDKWNNSILLTDSYIPWAIEWTEFYEIWLLTGKWHGGGVHPSGSEKNDEM